jgi:hypothetical protein
MRKVPAPDTEFLREGSAVVNAMSLIIAVALSHTFVISQVEVMPRHPHDIGKSPLQLIQSAASSKRRASLLRSDLSFGDGENVILRWTGLNA